jgi:hypothetical protein
LANLADAANSSGTGFALSFAAIGGLHFPISNSEKVMVHLDGGPVFTLVDGHSSFQIGALSELLGLSVVYLF